MTAEAMAGPARAGTGSGMGWLVGLAILYGIIWGFVVALIVGVVMALVTGLEVRPDLFAGMAACVAVSLVLALRPIAQRTPPFLLMAGVVGVVIFLAASMATPFARDLTDAPLIQAIGILAVAAGVVVTAQSTFAELQPGDVNRRRIETSIIAVCRGLGFVIFTTIVVLPFYVMLMTSLKNQQLLLGNPLDFTIDLAQGPEALFRSYIELFRDFRFGQFMLVSTLVSVGTVIITLAFAIPGAYAVARLRFKGRALSSRSILMIYMVPAIVLVIPLYAIFSQLGLRNTLLGLLIVYPATPLPVALYMLQGYFRGLPFELEEAGQMDGYSRLSVIWHITLPLSLPAVATVALYVFMIAWNEFLFAFMFLDDTDKFTLSRGIVSLNSSEIPRQHLMAGAVVATVPILMIFLYAERFLVQGLTAGSVKG